MKSCSNFRKSFFVLFDATAEFVNCSLFLKNLEKTFLQIYSQRKKNRQTHGKYTATFIGKIYRRGDDLSITDIALRN